MLKTKTFDMTSKDMFIMSPSKIIVKCYFLKVGKFIAINHASLMFPVINITNAYENNTTVTNIGIYTFTN